MGLIVEFTSAASDPMQNGNVEDATSTTEVLSTGNTSAAAPSGTTIIDLYAKTDSYWFKIDAAPSAPTVGGSSSRFIAAGERRQFRGASGLKVRCLVDS